jgi:hypothetical protein
MNTTAVFFDFRNFAIYVGFTLLLKNIIDYLQIAGGNDQLFAFGILMAANSLIPVLHPLINRLSSTQLKVLEFVGLGNLINIFDVRTFVLGFQGVITKPTDNTITAIPRHVVSAARC